MDYITRHIGPDAQETEVMLQKVGYDSSTHSPPLPSQAICCFNGHLIFPPR